MKIVRQWGLALRVSWWCVCTLTGFRHYEEGWRPASRSIPLLQPFPSLRISSTCVTWGQHLLARLFSSDTLHKPGIWKGKQLAVKTNFLASPFTRSEKRKPFFACNCLFRIWSGIAFPVANPWQQKKKKKKEKTTRDALTALHFGEPIISFVHFWHFWCDFSSFFRLCSGFFFWGSLWVVFRTKKAGT